MAHFPRFPDPTKPVSPELIRQLMEYVRSLTMKGSQGIKVRRTSAGTTLKVDEVIARKQQESDGTAAAILPFDVTLVDFVPGTSKTASVSPGSINNIIPSNYLTTYTLLNVTQYFLVLSVTVSSNAVASCTLSCGASAPTGIPVALGAPPTSFEVLLGVVIDGVWYRTIGDGSLTATSMEAFRVSKSSPAPGTLPYDLYYTWQVTND